MDKEKIHTYCDQIDELVSQIRLELDKEDPAPLPEIRMVTPEQDLQAELNLGGKIQLVAGATYPGVSLPTGTHLIGNDALIQGVGKPALYVTPNSSDIYVEGLICTSNFQQAVVLLGDNDNTQTMRSQVPTRISLKQVRIPTHRGKRGFEINAGEVLMVDCETHDVWHGSVDSAGIGILNSPGHVTVLRGVFEAGSHPVLCGGIDIILTDAPTPETLLFDGCLFTRPASWQTDGVNRRVKTIFELKNARGVTIRNCIMENVWTAAQTGVALMLTPTRMGVVQHVLFEDSIIRNCGAGMSITGSDVNQVYTDDMWTQDITLRRCDFTVSKALYPGSGRLVLSERGVKTLDIENCRATIDGTAVIYITGSPLMERLSVKDSIFNCGKYGINIAGGANLSSWQSGVVDLTITGNTMSGAESILKTNIARIGKTPTNTYV